MTGLDHKLAVITFETRPKAKKKTQKLSLLLRNPAKDGSFLDLA